MQTIKPRARPLGAHAWYVTDHRGITAFDTTLDRALALYFRCVLHVATETRR
ncbi:hypothetical protein K6Y76_05195 [Burkholderia cenocepacia]|uniref:hypothetical protein n=1 Tax=Burkholderia cenocepacia TaxID=95486 RepID=UPI002230AF25|nr:hypothetical protein [Burkholderia cenocepacia]MCW3521207.1 hypothetical protein [Burkholderia cenocepacia]MCW3612400.1 hypothetical protein [Burkholderia cenocepacia]MCW3650238.1 hypothetical protein [Burkholderia cenocepacia]MCW3664225.1 hypothetical protein [Burkholderia cenocepacia]MCW3678975.1 hypothetical protein [Burkholderia cenocepacia]